MSKWGREDWEDQERGEYGVRAMESDMKRSLYRVPCCMGLAARGVCTCAPTPRRNAKSIFSEFLAGSSMQYLAEKYGMNQLEIESVIRFQGRKP